MNEPPTIPYSHSSGTTEVAVYVARVAVDAPLRIRLAVRDEVDRLKRDGRLYLVVCFR